MPLDRKGQDGMHRPGCFGVCRIDGIAIRAVGHPGQQRQPRSVRPIVPHIRRGRDGAFSHLPEESPQGPAEQAAVHPFEPLGPVADQVAAVLDDLLATNQQWLPQFE